jgi:hypothetical protein
MRRILRTLLLLPVVIPALAIAAEQTLMVELNAAETASNKCSVTFLVENKNPNGIESIKLDLAIFNPEGIIQRRMVTELGPVRAAKTSVKTFALDGECAKIGSILVNDVTVCTPGDPGACLDQLALTSRIKSVRFYK